jgi:hypothetical protein
MRFEHAIGLLSTRKSVEDFEADEATCGGTGLILIARPASSVIEGPCGV